MAQAADTSNPGAWHLQFGHRAAAMDVFDKARRRVRTRRTTTSSATSVGVVPTLMPAASSASFFAWAVPEEPEMIAPAWPIVLPGGAEKPAMYENTGFDMFAET